MRIIWLHHPIFKHLGRRRWRFLRYGGIAALAVILIGGAAWDQYRNAPFHVVQDDQHHYWIKVRLNNVVVPCLVDTGSTNVLITKEMADRVGLHDLKYNKRGSTANGIIRIATASVERFEAAGILFSWFEVNVSGAKDDTCLLGSSFLSRVSYTAASGVLTIWPKTGV